MGGLIVEVPPSLQLWPVISLSIWLHLSFLPQDLLDTGLLNSSSATMSAVYWCLLEHHVPDRRLMMCCKVSLMREVVLMVLHFLGKGVVIKLQ